MMLLVLSATFLLASQEAPAPPAATPQEEQAAEKMICRKDVVTGTRSQRKRICMTQQQWQRLANNSRDQAHYIIDRANEGITKGQ